MAASQDPRMGRGGGPPPYPVQGRPDEEYDYQGYEGEEEPQYPHDRAGSQAGTAAGRRALLQTPLPGSQQLRDEGGAERRADSRSRDRERSGRDSERGSAERDRGHNSPSRDRRRPSSDRDNPSKRPRKSDEREDKPKSAASGRDRERKRK